MRLLRPLKLATEVIKAIEVIEAIYVLKAIEAIGIIEVIEESEDTKAIRQLRSEVALDIEITNECRKNGICFSKSFCLVNYVEC